MKHTKGPWREYRYSDSVSQPQITIGTVGGTRIADNLERGLPITEALANAKLIAAAPDMLATLRAIANDCDDYLSDNLDMDAGELCQAFFSAINEVYVKATGKFIQDDVGQEVEG